MADDKQTRIAIVSADKCKPKKCRQECKRSCPVVRMGKNCIEVKPTDKIAFISEELCIGCGICVKKCPFEAISIINLPKALERLTTHRYGPNAFKLHRLPMPRPGQVLGLVGTNGIGQSLVNHSHRARMRPLLGPRVVAVFFPRIFCLVGCFSLFSRVLASLRQIDCIEHFGG
jgi:ATP-binding cassette subfamily E protein 1